MVHSLQDKRSNTPVFLDNLLTIFVGHQAAVFLIMTLTSFDRLFQDCVMHEKDVLEGYMSYNEEEMPVAYMSLHPQPDYYPLITPLNEAYPSNSEKLVQRGRSVYIRETL